jgi:hypothetical protein
MWETIDLGFEGYFMCRLTTDPDPTDEKRGVSGYTLALASEDDLDNWIQLNPSPSYIDRNLREPGKTLIARGVLVLGVKVTGVQVNGQDHKRAPDIVGAAVNLLGAGGRVPAFEGRNDIVGSDDNVEFPIDPFIIDIKNKNGAIHINRQDVLPNNLPIWKLPASAYQDRVGIPNALPEPILEVMEAIGVYDFYEFFRNRAKWINHLMEQTTDPDQIQMYKTRLYVIEFFGDRIRSRLGMQRIWNFQISGSTGIADGLPEVDISAPWPVNFWFGGFDGDLMIGYMRGALHLPLKP